MGKGWIGSLSGGLYASAVRHLASGWNRRGLYSSGAGGGGTRVPAPARRARVASRPLARRKPITLLRRRRGAKIHRRVRPVGSGSTYSAFIKRHMCPRRVYNEYKMKQPLVLTTHYPQRVEDVSGGFQATAVFPIYRVDTDISGCIDMCNATDSSYRNWTAPAVNNNVSSGAKVFLEKVNAEFMITNQNLANVFVDIYDISVRRDIGTTDCADPASAWDFGTENIMYGVGGDPATHQGTSAVPYAFLGNRILGTMPMQSPLFTQYYKIDKITHVELGQGRSHAHRVLYSPRRMLSNEVFQQSVLQGITQLRNLTRWVMIVAKGAPVDRVSSSSTVTTAPIALDVVESREYFTKCVPRDYPGYTFTDSLYHSATGVADFDLANPGSGTVTADAEA